MTATHTFSSFNAPPSGLSPVTETINNKLLVQMIQSRSERGFHMLYDMYSGALLGIIMKFVRRSDVAEDLLQETFVKIWKHIDGFDAARGTLFTWMLNIARNISIDYLRSATNQQQLMHVNNDLFSLHTDYLNANVSSSSITELKDIKTKALQLDQKYAAVIDLIFFYGYTQQQAAVILSLPLGTVKTRARKGLELMKILYRK